MSESAEEKAYRAIINMIIFHQCAPGTSVIEKHIAESIGISRTPVRNAMRRLVSDGILEYNKNKGCFVPILSRYDLDNLFQFRTLIECSCIREATVYRQEEDVKKIHALVQEELFTLDNQKENIYIVNEKIHLAIAAASKNNYYEKPVRQSIWRTQLYLFFFDSFYMGGGIKNANIPIGSFKSCEEHQMLLYAIEHKDVSLAETTMRQHIMATYKLLVQTY